MSKLYVSVASCLGGNFYTVPLASLITLFTMKHSRGQEVCVVLVSSVQPTDAALFTVDLEGLKLEPLDTLPALEPHNTSPTLAQCCQLPVLVHTDGVTCIAGLCAVLRNISEPSMLGFRRGCLVACAEVSLWTRYCEVDMLACVQRAMEQDVLEQVPCDVARFEAHMGQPLRIHNILKQRQQLAKRNEESLEHAFTEGPTMTLSDVILFPCFYILQKILGKSAFNRLPLTLAWYNKMFDQPGIYESVSLIVDIPCKVVESVECCVPTVPLQSLYKSDPKRYKPANRIYTRQDDIDISLQLVSEIGLSAPWLDRAFGWSESLDWSTIPWEAHPEGGDLPASRVERKREQLENMARAVVQLAKPGDVIVDFCSGSGHLGLLLAVVLPSCRVLLLENKAESQARARARGARLGLHNVTYVQSNLDYFSGHFDVGVALHACGVATDLVLQRCVAQRAAFAVCPCCYGGVQPTHGLQYPRSALLRPALALRHYLVLAHAADQTHGAEHEKTAQGNQCMAVVDGDRCRAASERGYQVSLSKMEPSTCSPKNNLLVGIPSDVD